jgi:hypothetical protein
MKSFYNPELPIIGHLEKWGSAQGMGEDYRKELIGKFLDKSEIIYTSKIFGSRNPILMFQNCDSGWLFITNRRILFWSDKSNTPHSAIDFESITECNSRWAIMKMRSVEVQVDGTPVKFGTHRVAARLIEKLVNNLNKKDD